MDQPVSHSLVPAPGVNAASSESPAPLPQQPVQVQVDDSQVAACYANFCRIMGTPEELIIDFGLNLQPTGVPTQPVVVNQRIVTNMYTAKRLIDVLQLTVQRHEAAFGVVETDIQKRTRRP